MQIVKSSIIVAFFTLLSRIFGYVRDILMASYLGLHADSFAVAFRLPNTFRSLFAEGAFSSAFVPMFAGKLASEGEKASLKFASQVFSLLFVILSFFIFFMMIFMADIIPLLAPGFIQDSAKLELTINLAYFTSPYLFFIALASLYAGVMNSFGRFAIAASLPIILNLVMILAIKFLTPYSPSPSYALSYGVFIAGALQLLFIIIATYRASLQIKFTKIVITADMKKMFKNMLPAIIGSGVVQINLAIDTIIASFIDGAASIIYYADRLNQFPLAIIGTALGTVLLPTLSRQIRSNQQAQAVATQNKALEVALFFTLPCAFALAMISDTLVSFLFERGSFTHDDSLKVAKALTALAFGLPAFVMIKIFTPRFFAEHDTSTPVKISAICIVTNVVFCLSLVSFFSYVAIMIATSISAWINVSLLYYIQHRRGLFTIDKKFWLYLLKVIISCILMICSLCFFEQINFTASSYMLKLSFFATEIIIAMIVYFLSSYILGTFKLPWVSMRK